MNFKLIFSILSICLSVSLLAKGGQRQIELVLIDADKSPVKFASVLGVDVEIGAVSNHNGIAQLTFDDTIVDMKLYISSVGYRDTLINLNLKKLQKFRIVMQKELIVMEEVSVKGIKMSQEQFGNINDELLVRGDLYRRISSEGVGAGAGNIFKNKIKEGYIESIDIHFTAEKPVKYLLKFYSLKKFKKYFLRIPHENLKSIFNQNLIIETDKRGWLNYDLSSYNIAIKDYKYLVAVLVKLDENYTKTENGQIYLDIALQEGKSRENVIFFSSNYFYVFSKKHDKMAIVLNCTKFK